MELKVIVCVSLFVSLIFSCNATDVRVNTRSGVVVGDVLAPNYEMGYSKSVKQFLGIPFAKPPVAERRFQPPELVDPWSGDYFAKQFPPACYQRDIHWLSEIKVADFYRLNANMSEDCLYLNIWVPHTASSRPAAVMVWIYGGGFNMGSSTSVAYDGKILATQRDVIVASMQYRVAALGFMSLGTDEVPGNMGLLDQQLALRWLKENIAEFGGDPERITIFGESAGSSSVSYHLLSRSSHKFFSRAIMQSGTANALWAFQTKEVAKNIALQRAKDVGCGSATNDLSEVAECLKHVGAETITRGFLEEGSKNVSEFEAVQFIPTVDGTFLSKTPEELILSNSFYNTDIMIGVNMDEGSLFLGLMTGYLFLSSDGGVHMDANIYKNAISILFKYYNKWQRNAIAFQYRNWQQPNSSQHFISGASQAVGDSWFVCSANEVADKNVQANNPVYFYLFDYKGSLAFLPNWAGAATHADEIAYVFGLPFIPSLDCPAEEKYLSEMMMTYWTNFAQSGNPNVGDTTRRADVNWLRRTAKGREYLRLTANPTSTTIMNEGPNTEHCAFWKHYLPTLRDMKQDCEGAVDSANTHTTASFIISIVTLTIMLHVGSRVI